jgi:multidrug efflux pump subunit AcrB
MPKNRTNNTKGNTNYHYQRQDIAFKRNCQHRIDISQAVHLEKTTDLEPKDIIKAAGIQRFRPIILTTLTTFFGLAPMILETSRQARMLIPMAVSIGFGILFATLITLVLIPSLYLDNA